ncbi:hypothetical protein F4820DRAFT_81300 [Hypoxylon rubiginosum]|uniref:Uncharacterized protein n=1 Tax=Hypoxylon rubiginosum TaxID=110542 RepID=A0ACB9YPJ8_9PEZI|nr:hypothetical protein F4820DRAFT_81300 [Hypoxylon rubiginosum]
MAVFNDHDTASDQSNEIATAQATLHPDISHHLDFPSSPSLNTIAISEDASTTSLISQGAISIREASSSIAGSSTNTTHESPQLQPLLPMPQRKPVPELSASLQETTLAKARLSWRPTYLKRRALLSFAVVLMSTTAAIEVLAYVSDLNQGLATSQYRLHYIWKYGPTAILSVLMAYWGRVEYHAKITAPWYQLWNGPAKARQSVLLDYISPLLPVAIYQAVKYRDFLVAAAMLVSLALRVIIILSTSFISLIPVQLYLPSVPVALGETFSHSVDLWVAPQSQELGSFASQLYTFLEAGQAKYPLGLQESFTYQDFKADPAPFKDITTITDAFSGALECHETNYINISVNDTIRSLESRPQSFDVGNCTVEFNITFPPDLSDTVLYGRASTSYCDENFRITEDGNTTTYTSPAFYDSNYTLQVYFMEVNYGERSVDSHNHTHQRGVIQRWLERTCTPSHVLRKVAITRTEGENDRFAITNQPPRALPKTKPWAAWQDLNNMFLRDRGGSNFITNTTWIQTSNGFPVSIMLDGLLARALEEDTISNSPSIIDRILDSPLVESQLHNLFESYAAFLGFMYFKEPIPSLASNATATATQTRLLVTAGTAHAMAGLSGSCILLLLVMIFRIPRHGILPRSPVTIIGMAALMHPSQRFTRSLENKSASSNEDLYIFLRSSQYSVYTSTEKEVHTRKPFYLDVMQGAESDVCSTKDNRDAKVKHPLVLHPVFRTTMCFIVAAVVITLEYLLRKSDRDNGLIDLEATDRIPYAWTILPAIVLSLLSIYYSTAESQVRLLVPYNNLLRGSRFESTLSLDLVDRFAITGLVSAAKLKLHMVVASIATSFVAFFLTIAAGSLFSPMDVPSPVQAVQLSALNSLNYATFWDAHSDNASLILGASLDYLPFTHEDLAFPQLQLSNGPFNGSDNIAQGEDIVVIATVPVARSSLSCKIFDSSAIQATFEPTFESVQASLLNITIDQDNCTNITIQIDELSDWIAKSFYFGVANPGSQDWRGKEWAELSSHNCGDYVYAWGHVPDKTRSNVSAVSAMVCNETAQEINVKATFFGLDLEIRPDHPPQPDIKSAHVVSQFPACPWEDDPFEFDKQPNCKSPWILYRDLWHLDTPHVLDKFFSILTSPAGRLALDVVSLGDESAAQTVGNAIISQHKILRANAFGSSSRLWHNATDNMVSDQTAFSLPANVQHTTTRTRLVQDAISTRILEGLLTAILVLSLLSWYAMPNTKLLPRDPCSIASVVALLADGNILDMLPPNAQTMSNKELEDVFGDGAFYMEKGERGTLGIRYRDTGILKS